MSGSIVLRWHETIEGEYWHALAEGGRVFEITVDEGRFLVDVTEGQKFPEHVGDYASLDAAKRIAAQLFNARTRGPHDPLAAMLDRVHPERRRVDA